MSDQLLAAQAEDLQCRFVNGDDTTGLVAHADTIAHRPDGRTQLCCMLGRKLRQLLGSLASLDLFIVEPGVGEGDTGGCGERSENPLFPVVERSALG